MGLSITIRAALGFAACQSKKAQQSHSPGPLGFAACQSKNALGI